MYSNSRGLNDAFVKLMRRHIGKDIQIMTKGKFFTKLEFSSSSNSSPTMSSSEGVDSWTIRLLSVYPIALITVQMKCQEDKNSESL